MHDARRKPVGVMIVDEHPLYRDGLIQAVLAHPALVLLAAAATAQEAIAMAAEHDPQVIVLDLLLAGGAGWRLLSQLKLLRASAKILVLSALIDDAVVDHALRSGATGYLAKTADATEVCEAIVATSNGKTVLTSELRGTRKRRAQTPDLPQPTAREQQVLALLAEGRSTDEIARSLNVSPSTVKTHKASLYEKLGVNRPAAAIAKAFRIGLLE